MANQYETIESKNGTEQVTQTGKQWQAPELVELDIAEQTKAGGPNPTTDGILAYS